MSKFTSEQKEAARAYIQRHADNHGGRVDEYKLREEAEDPDNPLHPFCDWDDKKAADAHRLNQIRALIRTVKITITTDRMKIKTVAYVRDPSKGPNEAGYISVKSIRSDEDMKRDAVIAEFERVRSAMKRARALAAYFDMQEEIDGLLEEIGAVQSRFVVPGPESRSS